MDGQRPRVSRAAYLLGYAGLLPQAGAVALIALSRSRPEALLLTLGFLLAALYGALILSFLGGVWWEFAMRRASGQGRLAIIAVVPSLAALVLLLVMGLRGPLLDRWSLVLLGVLIAATLLVDRHLVATGEAPAGWMRLRVHLSLGLGGLTILAGLLAA